MSAGASARITITIERWTTDQEREALLNILKEKGQKELTAVLFKMPRVGCIRLPSTRGYDLKYARSTQNPDGSRKVVVATDRDLGFREVASSGRSKQYNFAVAEMHFPKSGDGEDRRERRRHSGGLLDGSVRMCQSGLYLVIRSEAKDLLSSLRDQGGADGGSRVIPA